MEETFETVHADENSECDGEEDGENNKELNERISTPIRLE